MSVYIRQTAILNLFTYFIKIEYLSIEKSALRLSDSCFHKFTQKKSTFPGIPQQSWGDEIDANRRRLLQIWWYFLQRSLLEYVLCKKIQVIILVQKSSGTLKNLTPEKKSNHLLLFDHKYRPQTLLNCQGWSIKDMKQCKA